MNAIIDSQLAYDLVHDRRRELLATASEQRLGRIARLARRRGRVGKPRRTRVGAPVLTWLARG